MPKFGSRSKKELLTCHEDLQKICNSTIRMIDFSVLEGHRSLARQQKLFGEGKSKLDGIKRISKHQGMPSMAVDIAPYPINFENREKVRARFYHLAGFIIAQAFELFLSKKIDYLVRWGGNWDFAKENGQVNFDDQSWDDLPHYELISPEKFSHLDHNL